MPVAASYSEVTLATLMDDELGPVADVLGWAAGGVTVGSYQHPINRALRAYGITSDQSITDATDTEKLEKLALREAWRVAVNHLTTRIDFSLDQQSFKRSQLYKQAQASLALAETAAAPFDVSAGIRVLAIDHRDNPYRREYQAEGARTLP